MSPTFAATKRHALEDNTCVGVWVGGVLTRDSMGVRYDVFNVTGFHLVGDVDEAVVREVGLEGAVDVRVVMPASHREAPRAVVRQSL